MKNLSCMLLMIFLLSTAASLSAGEMILYGGAQNPGKLSYTAATEAANTLLDGEYGSTMGIRFSSGSVVGYEQNISFSPEFGKSGVKAFQIDSNLILQAPGKVVPYVTAGIGFVKTWGRDLPTDPSPTEMAAFAFSFGKAFSLNYGGGIKLRRLMGPVGLNVDVRGYTLPDVRDGSLHFIQTSAGLVFSW